MTRIKNALLIGGPEHGKIYPVPVLQDRVLIAVFAPVNGFQDTDPEEYLTSAAYETKQYNKEILTFFGHFLEVFFWQDLFDNGTTQRHLERGRLLGELLLNDTAKILLNQGPS